MGLCFTYLYTHCWHSAPQSDCTSVSSKPPVALQADITTTDTMFLKHHKQHLGWNISWCLLGCALNSQQGDRGMRYMKSHKEEARSALLGGSNTLKNRDGEVDGWGILMIHTMHSSFSAKMSFLSEVRTPIGTVNFFYCRFFYQSLETHSKTNRYPLMGRKLLFFICPEFYLLYIFQKVSCACFGVKYFKVATAVMFTHTWSV